MTTTRRPFEPMSKRRRGLSIRGPREMWLTLPSRRRKRAPRTARRQRSLPVRLGSKVQALLSQLGRFRRQRSRRLLQGAVNGSHASVAQRKSTGLRPRACRGSNPLGGIAFGGAEQPAWHHPFLLSICRSRLDCWQSRVHTGSSTAQTQGVTANPGDTCPECRNRPGLSRDFAPCSWRPPLPPRRPPLRRAHTRASRSSQTRCSPRSSPPTTASRPGSGSTSTARSTGSRTRRRRSRCPATRTPSQGRFLFSYTAPGDVSGCWWFNNLASFHVWYPLPQGRRGVANLSAGWAASPEEAWDRYSAGAGPNGTGFRITNGRPLCPGGTPADGYDTRECGTQAVSGIGDRAAEGFGYIVFQVKGNTYVIESYAANPSRYILPDATLESLANKIADEAAAMPTPVVTVKCMGLAYQCPKPTSTG